PVVSLAADDETVALVRMYFAPSAAAAPPGADVVPVVPVVVAPAVAVVPVAVVPAVLVAPEVFDAEFDDASLRHPVTVTVRSVLDAFGCGNAVVCGAEVCAVIAAVAHAASAAHKLIWIRVF